MPPVIMFKQAALIFTVLVSLALAGAKAIDPGLVTGAGHVITQTGSPMTIIGVDQSSIRVHFVGHHQRSDGAVRFTSRIVTFYLTDQTVFSRGTRANAVLGAVVHITYHFEGDHTIADTVQFIARRAGRNVGK
jgi:hypothetical protein